MSEREPDLLLRDILDSADKIVAYTHGYCFDDFAKDGKTIDAVIRNFEIIGEAANKLPAAFKEAYPNIDWQRIRGFRNRIVHDYFGIDYRIVWNVIEQYLPLIKTQLQNILD